MRKWAAGTQWSTPCTAANESCTAFPCCVRRRVEKEFPWFAIFLGYPVLGIWYWCADQTIVQRVLGAKDENHARIGPLFCAVIKILPVFIFVLAGSDLLRDPQNGTLDRGERRRTARKSTA